MQMVLEIPVSEVRDLFAYSCLHWLLGLHLLLHLTVRVWFCAVVFGAVRVWICAVVCPCDQGCFCAELTSLYEAGMSDKTPNRK